MRDAILAVSFAVSILVPIPSGAQSYQAEVGAGFERTNWSTSHSDAFGLRGAYFFSPVSTEYGPLAEAEFLSRSSSLRGDVIQTRTDTDFGDVRDNNYHVSAGYASNQSPWIATLDLSRFESKFSGNTPSGGGHGAVSASGSSSTIEVAIKTAELGVGYYLADSTRIRLSYARFDAEHVTYLIDSAVSVEAKHLLTLAGSQAMSLTGALSRTDGDKYDLYGTTASVGTSYYFSNETSVGVRYWEFFYEGDGPDFSDREWSVLVSQFFAERYRFGVTYTRGDFAGSIARSFALNFDSRF